MQVRTLQAIGDALLALAAVAAGYAAWLYAVGGEWVGAAAMAIAALMPLAALASWRRPKPFGWGWMVPYGLAGAFLGLSAGGLLLYGLVPFGLGNLAWRWVVRARRADSAE